MQICFESDSVDAVNKREISIRLAGDLLETSLLCQIKFASKAINRLSYLVG